MVIAMSTNAQSRQPRQPRGTPVGGQFAGKTNPEPDLELDPLDGDDIAPYEPPAPADPGGGTTRPPASAASTRLDAMRARRAAAEEEDRRAAPYRRCAGTDAGHDACVAVLATEARGAQIGSRPAYLGRILRRTRQAERRDTHGITVPRRDQLALAEFRRRCTDRAAALGRTLSTAEEDDVADTYASSLDGTRRPAPGYHRPTQVVIGVPPDYGAYDDPDDATDYAYGPAQMAVANEQSRPSQLRAALGARVRDAGGPAVLPASIPPRAAQAIRAEVAAAGGAHHVAVTWVAGPTPLCAPWGTHGGSELVDAERLVIVEVVADLPPETADDLWRRSMSVASARSQYPTT